MKSIVRSHTIYYLNVEDMQDVFDIAKKHGVTNWAKPTDKPGEEIADWNPWEYHHIKGLIAITINVFNELSWNPNKKTESLDKVYYDWRPFRMERKLRELLDIL